MGSDSEVLLGVLAHELAQATCDADLGPEQAFAAVAAVYRRLRGSYAVIAHIAGRGMLVFRDPFGIRPLSLGRGADGAIMAASESVAMEGTGLQLERHVAPGEAVFITAERSKSVV